MTAKPTVFLSHSSKDAASLIRLKELLVAKTGGAVDFFLSSDGQSMPMGRNWVHSLQHALDRSTLMFVFVSPASLRSGWLYFEAGFCYNKDIEVVPLGYKGVDLAGVAPPLSLLQGFNVSSAESLNNIVAVVNKTFSHQHSSVFSDEEYMEVAAIDDLTSASAFGQYGSLIDDIYVALPEEGYGLGMNAATLKMAEALAEDSVEYNCFETDSGLSLSFHGFQLWAVQDDSGNERFDAEFDVTVFPRSLGFFERMMKKVISTGLVGHTFNVNFAPSVSVLEQDHKVSGRLLASGVTLIGQGTYALGNLEFSVGRHGAHRSGRGSAYLHVTPRSEALSIVELRSLISTLFDVGILNLPTVGA